MVQGLGFMINSFKFQVLRFKFMVYGLWFIFSGLWLRIWGLEFTVYTGGSIFSQSRRTGDEPSLCSDNRLETSSSLNLICLPSLVSQSAFASPKLTDVHRNPNRACRHKTACPHTTANQPKTACQHKTGCQHKTACQRQTAYPHKTARQHTTACQQKSGVSRAGWGRQDWSPGCQQPGPGFGPRTRFRI